MKRSIKKSLLVILAIGLAGSASAQKKRKNERYFDLCISPSISFRMLSNYKIPDNYQGTVNEFKDSLDRADRPGQNLNLSIHQTWKKNAFDAFSIGISYTTLSWRRVRNDIKFGDSIPLLGVIPTIIQAGFLQVKYDYQYRYLEVPIIWQRSAEGYGNLRDFDMWYTFGFSPAILLEDRVHIRTYGFSFDGETSFKRRDKEIKPIVFNVFGNVGYKVHYHLYHRLHGMIHPRLRIPVLPSTNGTQTIWLPQLSLDIGLVYLLDKEKDNKKK
jgi:hypothetical protein